MADGILGPTPEDPKGTDYLGREAPINVRGQSALPITGTPTGSPATGGATIGGGGVKPGLSPGNINDIRAKLAAMLGPEATGQDVGGGSGPAGDQGLGLGPGEADITGVDAPTISAAIGHLGHGIAPGVPGLVSLTESSVPMSAFSLGASAGKQGIGRSGLSTDLAVNGVPAAPSGRVSFGNPFANFVASILGLPVSAVESVVTLSPEMQAAFAPQNTAQLVALMNDPIASEFILNTLVNVSSQAAPHAGWTDTFSLTSRSGDVTAPPGSYRAGEPLGRSDALRGQPDPTPPPPPAPDPDNDDPTGTADDAAAAAAVSDATAGTGATSGGAAGEGAPAE